MTALSFRICAGLLALNATSAWAGCENEARLFDRAEGLYQSGQKLLSAFHFSTLSVNPCDPKLSERSLWAYSLSMSDLGETGEAMKNLETLSHQAAEPSIRRNARMLRAYLAPELSAGLPAEERATLELWRDRDQPQDTFDSKIKLAQLGLARESQAIASHSLYLDAPTRSPWLAAGLSTVLPGAGQAYVGTWQSAAVAFALNAAFLATTIELARKNLPATAAASGVVFSITYIGNILNAVDAAKRYTQASRASEEAKLRSVLLPELRP